MESGFFGIRWNADGQIFDGGHLSIAPGATDTHDHIWSQIPVGSHSLTFLADFEGGIAESNEDNNVFTLTFDAINCGEPVPPAGTYVALGDSFSSGDGAGDYLPGKCKQSNNAYPKVLANQLTLGPTIPSNLVFLACAGATTKDVAKKQVTELAQTDPSSIGLVAITVGGNDVGFEKVMKACFGALTPELATDRCVSQEKSLNKKIHALSSKLTTLYRGLQDAASRDRVLVLGYPQLFPESPASHCNGFSVDSQKWINKENRLLNDVIRASAEEAGVDFVSTSESFAGHEVCSADPYITGIAQTPEQTHFHPKSVGQARLAFDVSEFLGTHPLPA